MLNGPKHLLLLAVAIPVPVHRCSVTPSGLAIAGVSAVATTVVEFKEHRGPPLSVDITSTRVSQRAIRFLWRWPTSKPGKMHTQCIPGERAALVFRQGEEKYAPYCSAVLKYESICNRLILPHCYTNLFGWLPHRLLSQDPFSPSIVLLLQMPLTPIGGPSH